MRKSDDNEGFYAIAGLLLALPSAAWSGFVLTRLWTWFVVPLGVPPVTIWHAAGLFIVVSWLAGAHSANSQDSGKPASEKFAAALAHAVVTPPLFWLFGAIYHGLMGAQ